MLAMKLLLPVIGSRESSSSYRGATEDLRQDLSDRDRNGVICTLKESAVFAFGKYKGNLRH